jgi:nucleoid-associated protein YgaU
MNLFTQKQVEDLMVSVGCWRSTARIMSAIAMCEAPVMINGVSYSNFDAVGDQELANEKWGFSYGGFQVRSLHAQTGTGKTRDALRLDETRFNATSARRIKMDQGYTAWSTYTGGQYKAYLQKEFPAAPGTYVVVGGDTLSRIAQKASGGKWTWQDLALANGIVLPYTIYIGQTLVLPFEKGTGA